MRLGRSASLQPSIRTLAVAISLLAMGASTASAEDMTSEYQVKGAFLLNFTSFVEWPATAFSAPKEPLVLGIFSKNPFGVALDQMAKTKTIDGRPILIRVVSDPSALRSCHVVFFPASQMRGADQVMAALADLSILTVGEVSGFTERGGMINFVIEDHHVRFEVNPSSAERGHLRMSSKLLQLAIIVGRVSSR
jgi:YfiR/HmsC-like